MKHLIPKPTSLLWRRRLYIFCTEPFFHFRRYSYRTCLYMLICLPMSLRSCCTNAIFQRLVLHRARYSFWSQLDHFCLSFELFRAWYSWMCIHGHALSEGHVIFCDVSISAQIWTRAITSFCTRTLASTRLSDELELRSLYFWCVSQFNSNTLRKKYSIGINVL